MMTLGPIGFMQPWILLALAALPAIWWLLRFTPPSPKVVEFPPTRLLQELKPTEETPARSPWWLTLMRMLLAALLILALARPVINPDEGRFTGDGTMLLVVDNGWASAAHWSARREAIEAAIDRADRSGRDVLIVPTASADDIDEPLPAEVVRERIAGLVPQPYAPSRQEVAATLQEALTDGAGYSVIWLSDGLDYGHAEAFSEVLERLAEGGGLTVLKPGPLETPLGIGHARAEGGVLAGRIISGTKG
ncbi:MAG: BatA domain-containing protein, partial [Methyloceanibacter sp.]